MKKKSVSALLAALFICSTAASVSAAYTPTPEQQRQYRESGLNDAGVSANRTREYLERQRIARQLEEDKAKGSSRVEQTGDAEGKQEAAITFKLSTINIDESSVLDAAKLDELKAAYLDREVGVKDLYELVNKINTLYTEQGYYTCRAMLPAQTIKQGVVHIALVEGKTNNVVVQGNKHTKSSYITKRLALKQGSVANINKVNKDLLRFNAANDAQLRVTMQAGSEPGTTDYVISAYEPQNIVWTVYTDNAGSDTSGEYRAGLFFTDRSLTGVRDALSMSTMLSDGTKSFGLSYSRPMGHSGTKINVQYSTNSVHITDGPLEALNVRGHAYAASLGVSQPLVITEKLRTEASLDFGHQNSKTDFAGNHWLDDTIKGVTAAYSIANYGDSSIIYQKHGFNFGTHTNILGDDKSFGLYSLNGIYQKLYQHGQMISARLDGQLGFNNYMPSARQFYIGGMYSVRGYKESLLSGDSGYSVGLEYIVPVTKDKKTSVFGFIDHGKVFGDSAFDDSMLTSAGLGVRSSIGGKVSASLALGVPFEKDINGKHVDSSRVHFMVSGQF